MGKPVTVGNLSSLGPAERRLATRRARLERSAILACEVRAERDGVECPEPWQVVKYREETAAEAGGMGRGIDGKRTPGQPVRRPDWESGQTGQSGRGGLGGQARAAEPRSAYGYRKASPGVRVSAEQDINWGTAPARPTPAPNATSAWGKTQTKIELNTEERAGMQTDFKTAAGIVLPFTRLYGQKLLDAAQNYDGLSLLVWLLEHPEKVKSDRFKSALQTFMGDPRVSDAVAAMRKAGQ